jgi:hypothetical protein
MRYSNCILNPRFVLVHPHSVAEEDHFQWAHEVFFDSLHPIGRIRDFPRPDAPDFEMPDGTGNDTADIGSSPRTASRDTAPAMPPPAPNDEERARESSLFPAMSRSSERSPGEHPSSNQTAVSEQKTDAPTVRLTATQARTEGLFVSRSTPRSPPKSE